jgi:hypothetical protein
MYINLIANSVAFVPDFQLAVATVGSGTVSSVDGGIDCGADCGVLLAGRNCHAERKRRCRMGVQRLGGDCTGTVPIARWA